DPRTAEVNEGIKRCSASRPSAGEGGGARPVGDEPLGDSASARERKVKEHVDRGADLFAAGKLKEAREEFAIARTLAPEKATPFRWIGLVDARLDRCADAIQNLDVFLKRVPASDARVPEVNEVVTSCRQRLAAGSSGGGAEKGAAVDRGGATDRGGAAD